MSTTPTVPLVAVTADDIKEKAKLLAPSADAKMITSGRLATREELPTILEWLDQNWPSSLFIYHQVRHTIEGTADFIQFYVNYDDTRKQYLSILSRNLRWQREHETIHVFASDDATHIWPCMKACMIDSPLPLPLRSSPTPTSHTFRFACIPPKYFAAMQAFMSANFVYGPGCPTTAPSWEKKPGAAAATTAASSPTSDDEAKSKGELVPATISNYACWTFIMKRLEDLKPAFLPTNWPQRAPAADEKEHGVITITSASLRRLETSDVELINSQWVYRNGSSLEHLTHSVINYPSVGCVIDGTVTKDGVTTEIKGKLVAWILGFPDGSIGTLNTLPEYRRLGLGQAVSYELIRQRMTADSAHPPFLFTTQVNVASMTLFSQMGFTILRQDDWTAADGVVPKPTSVSSP